MSATDSTPPAVRISRSIARVLRDVTGRGATNAHTTIERDHVVVMLEDTLTQSERVLVEYGHGDRVIAMRASLQEVIREPASRAVEEATGRRVAGFMSANHLDPDRSVEIFLLDGHKGSGDIDRHAHREQ